MGDGDDGENGDQTLRSRLASAWREQRTPQFFRIVHDELLAKIHRGLRPDFGSLSDEDLDDCIGEAVTTFIRRNDATIANPESYIWTSAKNQARDLVEERAQTRQVEAVTPNGELPDGISDDAAVVLIEGLVEDIEAAPSWAAEVVQVAVARLRPALRRTVVHILANGTDCDAASAAQALDTTAVTFRANKSNAYTALRSLLPIVIAEMGIVPPTPRLADLFADRHAFAEDDD